MLDTMLTTIDNPYNPFDHFDEWFNWDFIAGYNTCSKVSRICYDSYELSPKEREEIYRDAALDILDNDPTGKYTLICRGEKTPIESS